MIEFQEFKVTSWNIRGAVNKQAKSQVRQLALYKANVFCIMETHVLFARVELF